MASQVRRDLVSAFKKNREKAKAATAYSEMMEGQSRDHTSRWKYETCTVGRENKKHSCYNYSRYFDNIPWNFVSIVYSYIKGFVTQN